MNIFSTINYYANVLIIATIFVVAIAISLLWYFVKVKKIQAAESRINYDYFEKRSTLDYLKFDDIYTDNTGRGLAGGAMIVIDENTFVSGIEIIGYNYEQASAGEKQRTMMGAVALANIIDEPVQLRQNVRAINMESNLAEIEQQKEEQLRTLVETERIYTDLTLQLEASRSDDEMVEMILSKISECQKKIASAKWKIEEAEELIRYGKMLQNQSKLTDRSNQLLFSYHYNPDEFTQELSGEEVLIKAMTALRSKIGIYTSALSNCGCTCKPIDAEGMTELIYKHMHPINGDKIKINDIINSNLSHLFISTDSIFELEEEKLGESGFYAMMNDEDDAVERELEMARSEIESQMQQIADQIMEFDQLLASEIEEEG